jgi:hypothetical protein
VRNIPAEWKRLFMEAGVKKSELQVRARWFLLFVQDHLLSLSAHLRRPTPPPHLFLLRHATATTTRTRRPGRPSSTPFASPSTARRPRLHPAVRASTRWTQASSSSPSLLTVTRSFSSSSSFFCWRWLVCSAGHCRAAPASGPSCASRRACASAGSPRAVASRAGRAAGRPRAPASASARRHRARLQGPGPVERRRQLVRRPVLPPLKPERSTHSLSPPSGTRRWSTPSAIRTASSTTRSPSLSTATRKRCVLLSRVVCVCVWRACACVRACVFRRFVVDG